MPGQPDWLAHPISHCGEWERDLLCFFMLFGSATTSMDGLSQPSLIPKGEGS